MIFPDSKQGDAEHQVEGHRAVPYFGEVDTCRWRSRTGTSRASESSAGTQPRAALGEVLAGSPTPKTPADH